jgi:hypothetical protein
MLKKRRYWLLAPLVAAGLVFMGCEAGEPGFDDGFGETETENGGGVNY